jgi:hypothetical protein
MHKGVFIFSYYVILMFTSCSKDDGQPKIRYLNVEAKILNIREHANENSKIIDQVKKNDKLELLVDTNKTWLTISHNGIIGYANSSFLKEYKPLTKIETFFKYFFYSFVILFIFLSYARKQVNDKRYSKGFKDGDNILDVFGAFKWAFVVSIIIAIICLLKK